MVCVYVNGVISSCVFMLYINDLAEYGVLRHPLVTDFTSLIIGILGSLIAALIMFCLKKRYDNYRIGHSEFSGYWRTDIYEDDNTTLAKTDFMLIKHDKKTNEFRGDIKREKPEEQNYRDRVCRGVFTKDIMLVVVWSKKNLLSHGASHLVMTNDYEYSGYYQRYDKSTKDMTLIKLTCRKLTKKDEIEKAQSLFK